MPAKKKTIEDYKNENTELRAASNYWHKQNTENSLKLQQVKKKKKELKIKNEKLKSTVDGLKEEKYRLEGRIEELNRQLYIAYREFIITGTVYDEKQRRLEKHFGV